MKLAAHVFFYLSQDSLVRYWPCRVRSSYPGTSELVSHSVTLKVEVGPRAGVGDGMETKTSSWGKLNQGWQRRGGNRGKRPETLLGSCA